MWKNLFYITQMDWFEDSTQSVWNISKKFDTQKNIEDCTVLKEKVFRENHINRESKIRSSQLSHTGVINYMKLQAVVTPLSIYHGCPTQKTFWDEIFTQANMKNCGCHNVRKYRETKKSEQYIILEIYFNFLNLNNMKIKYSEPKYY